MFKIVNVHTNELLGQFSKFEDARHFTKAQNNKEGFIRFVIETKNASGQIVHMI